MSETAEDVEELLFFDTFSHEVNEDLNLDLVQFPKPVYITEVRIIPLGARVQADFPGGVRLGATNPSKFRIEFFVNDLGKPGASTFECLGDFEYHQNDCIHLECVPSDPTVRQIPTDGLVLRGWYTTITLAVYGKLTKAITEPIIASPVDATLSIPEVEPILLPVEEPAEAVFLVGEDTAFEPPVVVAEAEFYEEPAVIVPSKRPHGFKERVRSSSESEWDREEANKKEYSRQNTTASAASASNQEPISASRPRTTSHRDRSRSSSRERDYHRSSKRDWSHSPDYRHSSSRRSRTSSYDQRYGKRDRSRDRERRQEAEKRPRTPPLVSSPRHPRSPDRPTSTGIEIPSKLSDHHEKARKYEKSTRTNDHTSEPRVRSPTHNKVQDTKDAIPQVMSPSPESMVEDSSSQPAPEVFEPILSDDEIGDEAPEPIFDDSDIDYAALDNVLKPFDPTREPLEKFNADYQDEKELELANKILLKLTERDQFCISSSEFHELPADGQEMWVHSTEHLLQALHLIHNFPFAKRSEMLSMLLINHTNTIVSLIKIGLDWDCAMAQPQPAFKLRHLKIGARIVELLGGCNELIAVLLFRERYDLFASLFDLYDQQFMALSIRLQLIKAIYSCLDSKVAMDFFLSSGTTPVYQRLILVLQSDPPTRAKFALRSLLKKVNLYESLQLLREIVAKIFVARNYENQSVDHQLVTATLEEILKAYACDSISYSQPRRFLPVAAKYEIVPDKSANRSAAFSFHTYFECHAFLETLLLLVANRVHLPQNLLSLSLDLLESLVRTPAGLEYLYNRVETTGVLVKCLLGNHDDESFSAFSAGEGRVYELGLEIAYKVKSKYYLDAALNIPSDLDGDLVNVLHAFYALISHPQSRPHGVCTVAMDANVLVLVDICERERKIEQSLNAGSDGLALKLQSPIIGYAVDILDTTLRYSPHVEYLAEHGAAIVDLVKSPIGIYDDSISQVLQEMSIFLKPLDLPSAFAYDNILPLCELLKQSIEFIVTFPGDLITIVRMMHYLAVDTSATSIESEPTHSELKHKFVVLQLFSADGISIFCSVLDKICAHFEQPALHSAQLATQQGIITTQILLPTVTILQRMLTYVIRSRDSQFRDLTAIPSLLRTFTLANHIPPHSLASLDATRIQQTIIQTLLAYTQPSPPTGVDTETVHKSLWTQMIGELLKFTLTGPSNFMSGLQAMSELLPATLPVITLQPLLETEVGRLVTERQLWSAHLHPKTPELTDLLQTIAPTTQPALQHLLHRVCLQLADLAPNMSLLVAKSLVDLILMEEPHSQVQLLRLLIRLVEHGTVKVSLLSMLPGKFSELLVTILKIGTNAVAQALVFELIQRLMDPDVALDHTQLANALPSKEVLALFVVAAVEYFLATRSEVALRTMQRMTRIDLPLFLLRSVLDTKKEQLNTVLEATALEPMLDFLIDFVDVKSEYRTSELGPNDLAIILNWRRPQTPIPTSETSAEPVDPNTTMASVTMQPHPIQKIADGEVSADVQPKLQILLDKLALSDVMPELSELPEPALGLADGIVQQFSGRQVIQMCDQFDENHEYWPKLQVDVRTEGAALVMCDLSEVIKVCLSLDTNVTSDCKRLLHLSASPQSTRERTQTAPCFRTRRVEVEPNTGRMDKKIFVTRGRGFARSQPNRSDLFRSRPPNTSRPPSLHVDDFLALETCGAQPTGPTGYNKMSREIISIRGSRGGRGRGGNPSGNAFSTGNGNDRGRLATSGPNSIYRQNNRRTNSPGNWNQNTGINDQSNQQQHFRTATAEPVIGGSIIGGVSGGSHYMSSNQDYSSTSNGNSGHFSNMQRGRSRGGARSQRPFQR